jgi:hypothetical protein
MLAYFMSDSNRAYVKYTISAPMEGLVGPRPPGPLVLGRIPAGPVYESGCDAVWST